jgi:hypothetical protein
LSSALKDIADSTNSKNWVARTIVYGVADAGGGGGRHEIVRGRLEERERGIVERRRVSDVDNDVRAFQRLGQAPPAEQVHTGGERVRHRLVPARIEDLDYLRPDEPGPADDSDLHVSRPFWSPARRPRA